MNSKMAVAALLPALIMTAFSVAPDAARKESVPEIMAPGAEMGGAGYAIHEPHNTVSYSPSARPLLIANFSNSPSSNLYAPVSVQFTDNSISSGPIISWFWDFGDGSTSGIQNPQHTYTVPGIYLVKLGVSNGTEGDTVIRALQILPPPPIPPVINTVFPLSGPAGTTVTISGSGFSNVPGNNTVYIGAVKAPVTAASATALTVTIPAGTTYGPITVTSGGLTGTAPLYFNATFTGDTSFAAGSFTGMQQFASGTSLAQMSGAEDFDGDGKVDMVVLGAGSYMAIHRNVSTPGIIAFDPLTQNFPTLSYLNRGLNTCDFDGDGKKDVLFVSLNQNNFSMSNKLSVYRNTSMTGAVDFAARVDIPAFDSLSSVKAADFNGDGRPDIAIARYTADSMFSVMLNTSSPGSISFGPEQVINGIPSGTISNAADMDQDGKADLLLIKSVVSPAPPEISVIKNTSAGGIVSFAAPANYITQSEPQMIATGDLDGDGKLDIVVPHFSSNIVSVYRNISSAGVPALAGEQLFSTGSQSRDAAVADMNGDGKPDVVVSNRFSGTVSVLKNTSTSGVISFAPKTDYGMDNEPVAVVLADWDNDGKTDMSVLNYLYQKVTIRRNRMADAIQVSQLCPGGSTSFTNNINGGSYQWQLSTDSVNFTNIANGPNYNNTNSLTLGLVNVPSSWYGYRYRCLTNGTVYGNHFIITFQNRWTPVSGSSWGNSVNWSCGAVPDSNTDVVISTGSCTLSTSTTVRSLTVQPGASLTIAPGAVLTVLH